MPTKTDRIDAIGPAQIIRTGWCKSVHVKSTAATKLGRSLPPHPICANPLRPGEPDQRCSSHLGILSVGFAERAEEVLDGEPHAPPTISVVEALTRARAKILDQIRLLDAKVRSIARQNAVVRRLMSVPGVGDLAELAAMCFRTFTNGTASGGALVGRGKGERL